MVLIQNKIKTVPVAYNGPPEFWNVLLQVFEDMEQARSVARNAGLFFKLVDGSKFEGLISFRIKGSLDIDWSGSISLSEEVEIPFKITSAQESVAVVYQQTSEDQRVEGFRGEFVGPNDRRIFYRLFRNMQELRTKLCKDYEDMCRMFNKFYENLPTFDLPHETSQLVQVKRTMPTLCLVLESMIIWGNRKELKRSCKRMASNVQEKLRIAGAVATQNSDVYVFPDGRSVDDIVEAVSECMEAVNHYNADSDGVGLWPQAYIAMSKVNCRGTSYEVDNSFNRYAQRLLQQSSRGGMCLLSMNAWKAQSEVMKKRCFLTYISSEKVFCLDSKVPYRLPSICGFDALIEKAGQVERKLVKVLNHCGPCFEMKSMRMVIGVFKDFHRLSLYFSIIKDLAKDLSDPVIVQKFWITMIRVRRLERRSWQLVEQALPNTVVVESNSLLSHTDSLNMIRIIHASTENHLREAVKQLYAELGEERWQFVNQPSDFVEYFLKTDEFNRQGAYLLLISEGNENLAEVLCSNERTGKRAQLLDLFWHDMDLVTDAMVERENKGLLRLLLESGDPRFTVARKLLSSSVADQKFVIEDIFDKHLRSYDERDFEAVYKLLATRHKSLTLRKSSLAHLGQKTLWMMACRCSNIGTLALIGEMFASLFETNEDALKIFLDLTLDKAIEVLSRGQFAVLTHISKLISVYSDFPFIVQDYYYEQFECLVNMFSGVQKCQDLVADGLLLLVSSKREEMGFPATEYPKSVDVAPEFVQYRVLDKEGIRRHLFSTRNPILARKLAFTLKRSELDLVLKKNEVSSQVFNYVVKRTELVNTDALRLKAVQHAKCPSDWGIRTLNILIQQKGEKAVAKIHPSKIQNPDIRSYMMQAMKRFNR